MTEEIVDTDSRIRQIVKDSGYDGKFADVLCNLYRYMKEKGLWGACHSTCSALYVALSELGYSPKLCIGEAAGKVEGRRILFDHSWLEIDGQIIDFAADMTLCQGESVSNPIVLSKDICTGQKPSLKYGVPALGLDTGAQYVMELSFDAYMDKFPYEENGLWTVVGKILDAEVNIPELRRKYKNTQREYVRNRCGIKLLADI